MGTERLGYFLLFWFTKPKVEKNYVGLVKYCYLLEGRFLFCSVPNEKSEVLNVRAGLIIVLENSFLFLKIE